MSMKYLDRGTNQTPKYFTDEDNDKIVAILQEWIPLRVAAIKNGTPLPKIPEFVGMMVQLIVNKTSTRYNYSGYWFREDMVGDAVINILRYLHTFDVSYVGKKGKINFFSWVTMCLDRSFSRKISQEEEQKYFRMKAFSDMGGFEVLGNDSEVLVSGFIEASGIQMDFQERMGAYEEKREENRAKERVKNKEIRDAERLAKMPKGILRMLTATQNTTEAQLQEDFGTSQFDLEEETPLDFDDEELS